jgi:dipeptidyl aminopeptidase/acylaminoacyl peptidase
MTMPAADTNAVRFPSGEDYLVGIYYIAQTGQPAPLAVLLHGIPGSEKSHDLAHYLRVKGWHVLVIHFAGAWGSGGDYNIVNQVEDAKAAIDYALTSPEAVIDRKKIAVIGFSLGSRAALFSAAKDERIGAVVSIAGFSDFGDAMLSREFLEAASPLLTGTTPASLGSQFMALEEGDQPTDAIVKIAPRPVLVVHGTEDETVPFYHADNLAKAGGHVARADIQGANHVCALHRTELIDAIWKFLSNWQTT